MAFEVRMSGLILHVGEDADTPGFEKIHAALVNDPHGHVAMVVINGADLQTPQPGPYVLLLQKEDQITFDLPSGTAKTTLAFRDDTPPLKQLIKHPDVTVTADLDPAVKARMAHKNVVAYVKYPEGTLDILETYANKVFYGFVQGPPLRHSCAAKTTLFSATPALPWVKMTITHKKGAPTEVFISPTARIAIGNDASSGKHFEKFVGVMIEDTMLALAEEDLLSPCVRAGSPPLGIYVSPHPECSNSAWP